MSLLSKISYWAAGLFGIALWTGLVVTFSSMPLPVELVLAAMALVAFIWGHAVLFPRQQAAAAPASGGRMPRAASPPRAPGIRSEIAPARAARDSRAGATHSHRMPLPPADELPPLLRTPLEEAARMEARRLGEVLTATGLFGPVAVRLDGDGTALVAPIQESAGVQLPVPTLLRFAAHALQPEGLVADGKLGAGNWPGRDLAAAIDAHLGAAAGSEPSATRPVASVPPAPPAPRAWDPAALRLGPVRPA